MESSTGVKHMTSNNFSSTMGSTTDRGDYGEETMEDKFTRILEAELAAQDDEF